ncbi:hypothetical protein F9K96_05340 [Brucella anthropi]|uniref:hypothetical protein n=1 Tax=Brucella anthropi TaxID=529 RepID=UPI00124C0137|nr:hypothetical protein [Brucella anthropi]KAB2792567.1 hypothetical protein F9K96_05340 [Brucella anthropi]
MSATITDVSIHRHVGRFNWADPSQEEAQVIVRATIDGVKYALSDTMEPDCEYDYRGEDVIEAIDALEAAKGRYIFYSGRKEFEEKLALFRLHETEIRKAYALSRAVFYQRRAEEMSRLARAYLDEATESEAA